MTPFSPFTLLPLGSGFLKDLICEETFSQHLPVWWGARYRETDLLHDLLLLDQERAYNTVLDAVRAARATIGALDGLLGLGDLRVFAGAEGRDL